MAPPTLHPTKTSVRRRCQRLLRVTMLALLGGATLTAVASTSPATGETPTNVRIVIERVEERGCTDFLDGSDFYGRVIIDGTNTDFGEITDEDEISPTNWVAEKVVDADVTTSVPITIKIHESDGFLNFGDDGCDLVAAPGNDVQLDVAIDPVAGCAVSGHVSGACDSTFTVPGAGSEGAFVRFRVEVDQDAPPQTADDALVRCLHSPVWPQPGDDVTITVEALDPALNVGDTLKDTSTPPGPPLVPRAVTADRLEIWVGDKTAADQVTTTATTATYVVNDVPAGDLVYSCKVATGDEESFTGWRRTRVGAPASGAAIPIVLTGGRANRVDVVFVADGDNYTGAATNATFQAAVSDVIKGAYYGEGFFLARQGGFNFWLADQTGDAERVPDPTPADPSNDRCVLTAPGNWGDQYTWADSGGLLHADTFRDCASNNLFSSEPTSLGTVLHETGHAPFGLPDEYCGPCDGGYWENTPNATLWDTKAECESDAPTLVPPRAPGACRLITDVDPPNRTFWTSEPDNTDLMNGDRRPPQAGDIRRIDWYMTECLDGSC